MGTSKRIDGADDPFAGLNKKKKYSFKKWYYRNFPIIIKISITIRQPIRRVRK